jgi:hypothetical protein
MRAKQMDQVIINLQYPELNVELFRGFRNDQNHDGRTRFNFKQWCLHTMASPRKCCIGGLKPAVPIM